MILDMQARVDEDPLGVRLDQVGGDREARQPVHRLPASPDPAAAVNQPTFSWFTRIATGETPRSTQVDYVSLSPCQSERLCGKALALSVGSSSAKAAQADERDERRPRCRGAAHAAPYLRRCVARR